MGRTHVRDAVVLVTGAAGGLGATLTEMLATEGARVVATDVDVVALDERVRDHAIRLGHLDVTDRFAFAALVDDIEREIGPIDILVNNAGVAVAGDAETLDHDAWDRILAVNIGGVVNGVLAVYPRMAARRHGHIVNVASLAGLWPVGLLTPYAMSKHAVVGLSTSLTAEAAASGVAVTVACPGPVDTTMLREPAVAYDGSGGVDFRRYVTMMTGPPDDAERVAVAMISGIRRQRPLVVAGPSAHRVGLLQPSLARMAIRVNRWYVRRERRAAAREFLRA
jgi:NADP-dependent 3-hydroxy acid dehydrogenase YdfG